MGIAKNQYKEMRLNTDDGLYISDVIQPSYIGLNANGVHLFIGVCDVPAQE